MLRFIVVLVIFAVVSNVNLAAEVDFAHDVVPLLKEHCGKCHTGTQKKGGLSINSRESLLAGGESGAAVVIGKSAQSELLNRIANDDALRMPPEGDRLTDAEVKLIGRWIDEGLKWEAGFSFGPQLYEPPLKPRKPELPPVIEGRQNPIDRILDAYLLHAGRSLPEPLGDEAFLRRAYLDLIGLLPTPAERAAFLANPAPDKRSQLVKELLSRDVDYAEHWLTFWNDLLRNDYAGTGFITKGRTQISEWLYDALVNNMPYDQFARELIAPPTPKSAGFANGIRWRGEVSAGQTVEIQFAQSVGQAFLGINLKCASCHDSFIDRWTLDDAYGLAAIYSQQPLEIHRCDKAIGRTAQASWPFDELGQVDPQAAQPERLKQLAALLTHRDNGRFTRTIVNRLWHRLMGRGIVHPTDAMQTEPWNADLLDYLAEHLVENKYDLKQTLELIATSQAYQAHAERVADDTDAHGYHYAGPRAKRLTAEEFMDCIWQLTGAAPAKYDAPVVRGKAVPGGKSADQLTGVWVWTQADVQTIPVGETRVFRKKLNLEVAPDQAAAVVTCDNEYILYVNGRQLQSGNNWLAPDLLAINGLKQGDNEILIVAKNTGTAPGPAGLFFEARWTNPDGKVSTLATDESWEWSAQLPDANGRYKETPTDWQPAVTVSSQGNWMRRVDANLKTLLSRGTLAAGYMVRAGLLKSDFLMRSLGRPNRDQIVSVRPLELTTLEAIDLSIGETLSTYLHQGAERLATRDWKSPAEFINWVYHFALSRDPTPEELRTLSDVLGTQLTVAGMEDVLWAVVMLPEFQLVR